MSNNLSSNKSPISKICDVITVTSLNSSNNSNDENLISDYTHAVKHRCFMETKIVLTADKAILNVKTIINPDKYSRIKRHVS